MCECENFAWLGLIFYSERLDENITGKGTITHVTKKKKKTQTNLSSIEFSNTKLT